jgi:hypothetical protein
MSHLIAFRDGSYKKVSPVAWKHSQWIHFDLADGSCVMVNPANVNYIHRDIDAGENKAMETANLMELMQAYEDKMA